MNYCDCGALLTYSPDDTFCSTCFEDILAQAYGEGNYGQGEMCATCDEYLCFECGKCHVGGCSRSFPLQDTCWVGAMD